MGKKRPIVDPRLVALSNAAEWLLAVQDGMKKIQPDIDTLHRLIHAVQAVSADHTDSSSISESSFSTSTSD